MPQQREAENAGQGRALHLAISATYQSSLSVAPRTPTDVEVSDNGVTLLMDPMSASRADGIRVDMVETPQGSGFKIDNPSAPQVQSMTPEQLKASLDSGERLMLFDVRTPEERAQASIDNAALLTDEEAQRIEGLPRDTVLVFHCHHGGRSQSAAEHFVTRGFTQVFNLTGGIDAWSQSIDPSVPRY